jgi:toxin ParE1/3/4
MKKRRIVKRERALRDLELRSEYIRQHNPRAALRFLAAALTTIRKLAASPGVGARYNPNHPALAELRFFPSTGFKKDLIFHRPISDGIEIVRVLHGARDIGGILAQEFGVKRDTSEDEDLDESEG